MRHLDLGLRAYNLGPGVPSLPLQAVDGVSAPEAGLGPEGLPTLQGGLRRDTLPWPQEAVLGGATWALCGHSPEAQGSTL